MRLKINGKRIILRGLKLFDAQSIYENAKHKEVAKYIRIPYPYKLKDAISFIKISQQQVKNGTEYNLGIELKKTKNIIGVVGLTEVNSVDKNAEIVCWIGKKYWRQGFATEALKLIINFGFKKLKLERIYGIAVHLNKTSINLVKSIDFKYEGRLRKSTFRKQRWMDQLIYAILKDNWEKSRQQRKK